MKNIATTEINRLGTIVSLVSETPFFWKSLLPPVGTKLFSFKDKDINIHIKEAINKVLTTGFPTSFTTILEEHQLHVSLIKHAINSIYVCWEMNPQYDLINSSTPNISKLDSPKQNNLAAPHLNTTDSTLRRFSDNLPLVVFEIYLFPNGKFKLGFVNKEMEAFLPGQSTDAVNADNSLLFVDVHPDDRQKLMDSISTVAVATLNVWEIEYRLLVNGETKWIRGYGRPETKEGYIAVCTYLQDITKEITDKENLLQERTLLRTLIDNLPVSIFVKDEKGRKIVANKLDVEYMGLKSEKEALGKTDKEIFANNRGGGGYLQDLRIIKTGIAVIDEEGEILNNNGNKRDILVSKIPLKNEKGEVTGLIGICRDTTSIKKLEERLEIIDYANRNSNVSIYLVKNDATFYDVNEWGYQSLGYTKDEIMTKSLHDINPFYSADRWATHWNNLKGDTGGIFLGKHKKKDGTLIDVEINLKTFCYKGQEFHCSYVTDITQKKKQEYQLKLVEHSFRTAKLPMYFLRRDGSIYDYNEAFTHALGYSKKEFDKLSIFNITTRHTPDSWRKRWDEIKAGEIAPIRTRLKKKDNTLIDVDISANFFVYEGTELTFTSFIDVTEKMKLENRLNLIDFAFRNTSTPMNFFKENGTLYDFNNASCATLGYTRSEFQKIIVTDINPLFNLEKWNERWKDIKAEGGKPFYTKLKKKDGSLLDIEVRANIIQYGNIEINCATYIDITEKKKLEEKLRIVDYAFRNASTANHFLHKDGSVFDFNNAACRLLGYSKEEYKSLTLFDISLRHNTESWKERWQELKNNGTTSYTTKLRRKDNTIVEVEVRADIFDYDGMELSFTSMLDITDKKKKEEELKRSHERYENATIATSEVVWEWDLLEDSNYFSKNFTEMFGHPINGLQFGTENIWRSNLHPEDKERVLAYEAAVTRGMKDKWQVEYRLKKANGDYAFVLDKGFSVKDDSGNVVRLVGAMRDITTKMEEEERLQLLEKVVTETSQSVVIAVAIDGNDTPIIYANASFTRITGYTIEEVIGKNPRFLHKDRDVRNDEGRNIMRNAIRNYIPWKVEIINTKKNGEHYWAEVSGFPVYDANKGKYSHWVAIQTDITGRKHSEEEKEHLVKELVENNKELKHFGYITTHNLRAPLTNLVSICNLIDSGKIDDPRTKQLINGFKHSTMLLNETLNDLIKVLFIKENTNLIREELFFKDVLDKVKNSISSLLLKNAVKIEIDFATCKSVNFIYVYLESIFLNLMTNAIKYSHPSRHPVIKIKTTREPDGNVQLSFTDNGMGMNLERVRNRIFGLYQRFHNNPDSKGIGLYLVHSQITALGGSIDVDSEENIGTTFTIHFK